MLCELVNNDLEKCGRNGFWPNLRYVLVICMEKLRKTLDDYRIGDIWG